ncbi:hypothetical protein GCM10010495_38530 [Kitasatospora herbaricolor]|nr:hypothetical protein GCM10010495_38530 [Kitasatospora herbaricolor]
MTIRPLRTPPRPLPGGARHTVPSVRRSLNPRKPQEHPAAEPTAARCGIPDLAPPAQAGRASRTA